jgi:hypothetical protein
MDGGKEMSGDKVCCLGSTMCCTDADEGLGVSGIFVGVRRLLQSITVLLIIHKSNDYAQTSITSTSKYLSVISTYIRVTPPGSSKNNIS